MKFDLFVIIMAIAAIAIIAFYPVDGTNFGLCPSYELPEYLSGMSDGECMAIGILLAKATRNPSQCVYVTNTWWRQKIVTAADAIELAKGY